MNDLNLNEIYSYVFYKDSFDNEATKDLIFKYLSSYHMANKTILFQSSEYDLVTYLHSIGFNNDKQYYTFVHSEQMITLNIEGLHYDNAKYWFVKSINYDSHSSVVNSFIYNEHKLFKSKYRQIEKNMLELYVHMDRVNASSFNYFPSENIFYLKGVVFSGEIFIGATYIKQSNLIEYTLQELCDIVSKDIPKVDKNNQILLLDYFNDDEFKILDMYTV
jgi:hypothetical protein